MRHRINENDHEGNSIGPLGRHGRSDRVESVAIIGVFGEGFGARGPT